MPAAVLELIAGMLQVLDAVVERNDAGDFFSDGLAGCAPKVAGFNSGGKIEENFPFRARFADGARDFFAIDNPAFSRRLRAAAILFVPGFGRQENDFLLRI